MTSKLKALIATVAVLYGAEALADNTSPSMLSPQERATFKELMPSDAREQIQTRSGGKTDKVILHKEPRPFRDKTFRNADGEEVDLHIFDGRLTLVNFWATWCVPCRAEMPGLNALQGQLRDEGLTIAAISVEAGAPTSKKVKRFWKRAGLTELALFGDPKKDLSLNFGVLQVPTTIILGPDGREIGRVLGEIDWHSDEAVTWLRFLLEATDVSSSPDQKEASASAPNPGG